MKEDFYNWLDTLSDYDRWRFEYCFSAESYNEIDEKSYPPLTNDWEFDKIDTE